MIRPKTRSLSVLAGVALLVPLFAAPVAADNTQEPAGACTDDGVTVVVDLTDLGGEVEVGCAEGEPESGRDALESAGFETADSQPGMICAINSLPDPCPEEFDGNYWAYFTAEDGGEWTPSMEGADTAVPAPGAFEGWRYNDGSEAPDFEPVAAAQSDTEAPAAEEESSEATDEATAADDENSSDDAQDAATESDSDSGIGTWGVVGIIVAVAVIVAVLGWILSRRRQQN